MAGPPESLTLRQRLDEKATRTEINPTPGRPREQQEPLARATLERTPSPPPPPIPEKPKQPIGILDEFVSGIRASQQQSQAAQFARQARDAEKAGDLEGRDAYLGRAYERLQKAEAVGPSVKSYKEVDTVENAVRYALGLTGQSALSVSASIAGGAIGRTLAPAARAATGLNRLKAIQQYGQKLDNLGAFVGATVPMYGDIRGGTILAQEADPVISAQPVEQRERASMLTTLGSTALEAAVPAAIGARVGRRALSKTALTRAEIAAAGPQTGKGLLAKDMLGEGLTELSQENLEQFALHLQNPEQAAFASTEDGINAFFGGLAGGAFGHGVGRVMEKGVDWAARRKAPHGAFGMFGGQLRLDPKALALRDVMKRNGLGNDALDAIDAINAELDVEGINPNNTAEQLNSKLNKLPELVRRKVIALNRMFIGMTAEKANDFYKSGRNMLINVFKDQGYSKPQELVEQLEEQILQAEQSVSDYLNQELYKDDPQSLLERTLFSIGRVENHMGNPIEGFENLRIIDPSNPLTAEPINVDDYHFIFNAKEAGRETERHSPIGQAESRSTSFPAYIPSGKNIQRTAGFLKEELVNAGVLEEIVDQLSSESIAESWQLKRLIQHMGNSPYAARYNDVFLGAQSGLATDPDGRELSFDTERGRIISYAAFLDAANADYGTTEQQNYLQAAKAMIEELAGRNRSNADDQSWVVNQHNRQIQELVSAIEMEYNNSSNDGRALEQGQYLEDGTYVQSLKELFNKNYVVGAFQRQEKFEQADPELAPATRKDLDEMQQGLTRAKSQEDEEMAKAQAIPVLQRVPWPEMQLTNNPSPYRIVWLSPDGIVRNARNRRMLRREDQAPPKVQQLISEGLGSVLNMPETIGILETDADNNLLFGDPDLNGKQDLGDGRVAIGNVMTGANKFNTVTVTNKVPARKIGKNYMAYWGGDTASNQKYWQTQLMTVENNADAAQLLDMQLAADLRSIKGLPELEELAAEIDKSINMNNTVASIEGTMQPTADEKLRWKAQKLVRSAMHRLTERLTDLVDQAVDDTAQTTFNSLADLRSYIERVGLEAVQTFEHQNQMELDDAYAAEVQAKVFTESIKELTSLLNTMEQVQAYLDRQINQINAERTIETKKNKLNNIEKAILKIREKFLKELRAQLSAVRRTADEQLHTEHSNELAYMNDSADQMVTGIETVYEPPTTVTSTADPNLKIDLKTGAVTYAPVNTKEPRLPDFTPAGVKRLYRAVQDALANQPAAQNQRFNQKLSTLAKLAARQAYAFITDQKGATNVNVTKLRQMKADHLALVLLNSMEDTKSLNRLAQVAESKGSILLSPKSLVSRKAFDQEMARLGYAQHPTYPGLYITTTPLQIGRGNDAWAAEIGAYQEELNAWNEGLKERLEEIAEGEWRAEVQQEFLEMILWRANVWYNGPTRFDLNKGTRAMNVSMDARLQLAEWGLEVTPSKDGRIRLKLIKEKTEEQEAEQAQRKEKAKKELSREEIEKKAKESREKVKEKLANTLAAEFKTTQDQVKAGMATVTNWASESARNHLANFFNNIGQTDPERRMMRDLERSLFKNKRTRAQIEQALLNSDIRAEINLGDNYRSVANESVGHYYALAFQLATRGHINLSPTAEQWFKRIVEALLSFVGIHMSHYFGESVFTAIQAGELTGREDVGRIYSLAQSEADATISNIAKVTRKAINRTITAAPDVLRQYGVQGKRLADMFAVQETSDQKVKTDGFIPRRRRQNDYWLNQLKNDVFNGFSEADLQEGWEQYRVGDTTSAAAQAIEKYVNRLYNYMDRHGVRLSIFDKGEFRTERAKQRTWRVPMAFNINAISDNRLLFEQRLRQHGLDAEQASKVTDSILWAGGNFSLVENQFDQDSNPTSVGTLSGYLQIINKQNAKDFEEFMSNSPEAVLLKFTRQAVHKTEFTKSFGHNGREITQVLNLLKAQGLNKSELDYLENRAIPAMLGTLAYKMHPKWREVIGTVITIQNMAVLPLMIFPAMVDIWGISMVTGDMSDGWKAFKSGMREIRRSMVNEPDADIKMAEMLGIITDQSLLDRVGDTYNEMMDVSLLRKMNQKFFFLTGIEQWTKGIRIAAMHAATKYITEHRNDQEKLNPLGLSPADVKLDQDGNLVIDPQNDKMAAAINQFVDSVVLRPSAAHRPAWGSDPRWLIIWHLKQFTFTFHKVFLNRFITEMQKTERDWKVLLPFLLMVPTMMVSDAVKNIVAPSMYYDQMSFTESIQHAISRSSVLGIGTFGLDAMKDVEFGKLPGTSLLGPTIDSGYRFYDRGMTEGLFRLTPGYALWNRWL